MITCTFALWSFQVCRNYVDYMTIVQNFLQVAIPIDQFYGSHLRFIFKHRSSNDGKLYFVFKDEA